MTAYDRVVAVADALDHTFPLSVLKLLEPFVFGAAFVAALIDHLMEARS